MTTLRRPVLARGDRGPFVTELQRLLRVTPDGDFGPATDAALRAAQTVLGLASDGVAGSATWGALLGEPVATSSPTGPAAACRAALRDANARAPGRKRASDGIMGDAAHQARPSDHNLGNAVDITHDPAGGFDCEAWAELAVTDPRVTYVIWNRRIISRARIGEGWRPYSGSNPHTHHVHISIRAECRDDDHPWAWAPT